MSNSTYKVSTQRRWAFERFLKTDKKNDEDEDFRIFYILFRNLQNFWHRNNPK
jgi:hypothetical protein